MCYICKVPEDRYLWDIKTAAAINKYTVFPKRHVSSYFDLTGKEKEDIDRILFQLKYSIERKSKKSIKSFDVEYTSNTDDHLIVKLRAIYDDDTD